MNDRAIVETATDAIVTADSDGVIVMCNPAAVHLFGYEDDDIIGQSLSILVPERFRRDHEAGLARVVATGETRIIGSTVEVAGLRSDGSEFPIELSLATWIEDGSRFFTGIIRDVTQRVVLARDLAHSQSRLEAILRSANDAIISIDARGRVVVWNAYAERLFGYTVEEMIGEPLTAIVPERFRDGHVRGIERVVGGGERHVIGSTAELAGLHRDGREFPIELSLSMMELDGEQLFIGIIRDITERKKTEHALHLANKTLNEKNEQLEGLSGKLAKYLSRQVYDSIFEGRTEVKVESYRKELTVFFSDIQGFTDLTDRLEAERLSEILNSYLSEMATIADTFGGTIDKFIGDGIMIFFGDPDTRGRDKDAIACVEMALAMRQRVADLCESWSDLTDSTELRVRMGINTGFCTVGNFGSEDRMDYTIVGGPVNIASRLESTAMTNQIHISHETYSLVKDSVYCRPVGQITVKGISHELRTYEVIGHVADVAGSHGPIESSAEGFNLQLDPTSLGSEGAEQARKALQAALDALEDRDQTAQVDGS
jgi:PAS domain S-box-containing protein